MANYNKSFNFKNGVQVDTDKFIVNTAGLVGIGSTIPTDFLDVRRSGSVGGVTVTGDINVIGGGVTVTGGDVTTTGLVTSSQLYVSGVSTFFGNIGVGTANADSPANSNNTTILNAGIVTAVKYYGDAKYLSNATWDEIDPASSAGLYNFRAGEFAAPILGNMGNYSTRNIAIGHSALGSINNANDNVIIGHEAGYSATGNSNTFIGNLAGKNSGVGGSGIFNPENITDYEAPPIPVFDTCLPKFCTEILESEEFAFFDGVDSLYADFGCVIT